MRISRSRALGLVTGIAALTIATSACGDDDTSDSTTTVITVAGDTFRGELIGTFSIDGALCSDGLFIGSIVRFVLPGDSAATGPYVDNPDSPCTDQSYTALVPGTEGGLRTNTFQEAPDPAFDAAGNGVASAIIAPVSV